MSANETTERAAEAEAIAAVPDAAADIARKLLDQIVAAHASAAANAAELGEPYSAHPISIEGDARAIVAAVTPIIRAQALAEVRKNQLGMARGFAHDAEAQRKRFADASLDPAHIAPHSEGAAWGAVAVLQMLLMELGEVEFDEAAECTWDIVLKRGES